MLQIFPLFSSSNDCLIGFKRVKRPFSLIMNDDAISHELLLTAFEYNLAKQDHPATRNSTAIAYESQKVQARGHDPSTLCHVGVLEV